MSALRHHEHLSSLKQDPHSDLEEQGTTHVPIV
jgi:hypothetical protein